MRPRLPSAAWAHPNPVHPPVVCANLASACAALLHSRCCTVQLRTSAASASLRTFQ
ncbi:hypothetical protein PR003_g10646 [Phytophthora rubi]|uniref:Uncharacterized protein n=1 Tax=Phytophthora rubi TaxID=129364 RepID=A0A6A3LZQ7_9STRA|nr:hypothetical protein PR002_g12960 [Phytophthora rubi]KAE9024672.1 hypothetical protein PR001_g12622 [Phytophthora rubi]KAE9340161.1 hypothetical protein PR003_g10646 [Phytophthora rubi]